MNRSEKPIRLWIGGKEKGPCCMSSIDPGWGCINKCIACYAVKTNRSGNVYHNCPTSKRLDYEVLANSIKHAKKKGIKYARVGKHCDPGHHVELLLNILDVCNVYDFRLVVVTKSLAYDKRISKKMTHGHTLHMSLGMISNKAPTDVERAITGLSYLQDGVHVKLRIVGDVTSEIPFEYSFIPSEERIVTPIHFPSQHHMPVYGVDKSHYKFSHGYWMPLHIHDSWLPTKDFCGEVAGTNYCCSCKAA